MLGRLVQRSPTATPPSPRRIRTSLNKPLSSTNSTSRMREYKPGDPIHFQSSMTEVKGSGDWIPGQPIRFASSGGEERAVEGSKTASKVKKAVRNSSSMTSKHPFPKPSITRRESSPATSRATFNSSPNSSLEVSGNSSWNTSNRWNPPSPSISSIGDISCGSTARFSHSRSYARVPNASRSTGGSTQGKDEMENGEIEFGSFTKEAETKMEKVDVGVQTEASPVNRGKLSPRPIAPTPSKAELDELLSGVDFEDDSLDLDLDFDPEPTRTAAPSTSTPQHLRPPVLTQPQVEDLVAGIDFSEDIEMSDEEESQDTFHSAINSPLPSTVVTSPRPRSPRLSSKPLASPRFIHRSPRAASPAPPPTLPSKPDVFTLPSTSPRSPQNLPFPRPTKSPRSYSRSSPLILSSSQPSALPLHVRHHSTSQSYDSDDSLVQPEKMKGWESVVQSIESSQYSADSSVEIIEPKPRPATKKVDKGKGREIEEKENKPVSTLTTTKPGYFARPANLKSTTSVTTVLPSASTTSTTSTSTARPRPQSSRKEPDRSTFKGRNAEERYKSAYKQWVLQGKWPSHFDYRTWGSKKPEVVFTTNEKVVDETLAKLNGPVGFDLEWDMFDRITRGQGKTALVQVCDEQTILLVQVARMKTFPNSLKVFIEDPTKIKLGVQIAGDAKKLTRDYGFEPKGLLELNDLTKRYDSQHHAGRTGPLIGLQELVGIYLDRYLPKDHTVRCGVWSGALSAEQKSYGANDVYSSLHVLKALESLISSSTGETLNLLDYTTPGARKRLPPSSTTSSSKPTRITEAIDVPKGLEALPPRKLEAYQLFQVEKLSLKDTALKMSETNSIKITSCLWSLLGVYSSLKKEGVEVEWDEGRLVEAVDGLGSMFSGKMKAEHGDLVEELRKTAYR